MTPSQIAALIDHTLLKPDATADAVRRLCDEALEHGLGAVCVAASRVGVARERLGSGPVRVAAVVGFPHGNTLAAAKAAEGRAAAEAGADELDMVMNIGLLKDGDHAGVERDIAGVVNAAPGAVVKVILETALLGDDEKRLACRIAEAAGAGFVKTSTGFGGGGADVADVRLMRQSVGAAVGVKASGGIRTYEDAVRMIEAGANRLGCSASVAIVTQAVEGTARHGY